MGRGGAVPGKTLSPPKRNLTRPQAGDTLKFDGFVKSSPISGRPQDAPTIETILPQTFYGTIKFGIFKKNGG